MEWENDPVFKRCVEAENRVLNDMIAIRRRMDQRGMTVAEMAGLIGETEPKVKRWLAAERPVTLRALYLMQSVLDGG